MLPRHNASASLGAWGLWTTPDKRIVFIAANKTKGKQKVLTLKLGTWNVRTMTPGLSDNPQQVSDVRKTAVINNELCRLQVDIIALQKTRLPESGIIKERDYSFFWQDKAAHKTREHGVSFAIKNNLLGSIIPPPEGTERLLKLKLQTSAGLISTYAPALTSASELKDRFYDVLSAAISKVPLQEPLFIFADFNARVDTDHSSWPTCLGHFGI